MGPAGWQRIFDTLESLHTLLYLFQEISFCIYDGMNELDGLTLIPAWISNYMPGKV